MTVVFLSATYANAAHSAAIAMTADSGAVALSAIDTPEDWAALHASGIVVAAYVVPPPPVPDTITDRQFFQGCALKGLCTEAEALEAVKTGTLPSQLEVFVTQLPGDQRFGARMVLSGAVSFSRSSSLTEAFGQMAGMTPSEVDEFWRFCAVL